MGRGTSATNGTGTTEKEVAGGRENAHQSAKAARSARIAAAGVQTGEDFANLMSALMSDVIAGAITPVVSNAAVNAGGKLLKVVEMQYRYGQSKASAPLTLTLAPGA